MVIFMSEENKGALFIVTTPIGNLSDITMRALETLKSVDLIAAEDTRRTKILLDHFEIKTRLFSYHSYNEHRKTADIIEKIKDGQKVALVSDAGTPCIADPGFLIVREAVKAGIEPIIIPGVSSLTYAVAASGLPSERFSFWGFLPVKSGRRRAVLELIKAEGKTAVVFESPYRIGKALDDIIEYIGPDVSLAIIREATKIHEEVIRGTAAEIKKSSQGRNWKGEFVIVISRTDASSIADDDREDIQLEAD